MEASEYVINKLSELVGKYPCIKCVYGLDILTQSHYVKILPVELFLLNEDFHIDETNIIMDFISLYSNETITFFTESEFITIENPVQIYQGKLYQDDTSIKSYTIQYHSVTKNQLMSNFILSMNLNFDNSEFDQKMELIATIKKQFFAVGEYASVEKEVLFFLDKML